MKSAIIALLATTSALQVRAPYTQTPNPTVIAGMGGMAGPRVCEMGANNDDVGFSGCEPQTKYTPPVRGIKRAVTTGIGGKHIKDWKAETGPNTTPQAGRGGAVYIPFPIGQPTQPSLAQMQRFSLAQAPFTQTPNPTVIAGMGGMAGPRICEMGANNDDVGFSGCEAQTKYTPPVRGIKRAVTTGIGGKHIKDWKAETGPNTTPQAGRGGAVYIPFPIGQPTQPSLAQMQRFSLAQAPWTQTPTPEVAKGMGGMAGPRVCEMGANTGDVGFSGCELQTKYTVPVSSGKLADTKWPVGGKQSRKEAEGPNTIPRAGRGGMVYIPFAYAQQPQARYNNQWFAQTREEPSKADEEEAAYQKVYDAEQTRMKTAEKDMAKVVEDEEDTKALRDSNFRKFTSEELAPLIAKGQTVV